MSIPFTIKHLIFDYFKKSACWRNWSNKQGYWGLSKVIWPSTWDCVPCSRSLGKLKQGIGKDLLK